MKVTNKKYPNLNLANENERGENLVIDLILSSFFGVGIAFLTYKNFFTALLIYLLIRFIYYFTFEYLYGRTPGKYHTQTKVVNKNGGKPTIFQLIIRNLSRFFSLISGISDDEKAIHDSLSNTFVVKNIELKKIKFKPLAYLIFNLSIIITPVYFLKVDIELTTISDTVFLITLILVFNIDINS